MKIGHWEIIRTAAPIGNGSPCYGIRRDGGHVAGFADTQIGAATLALGADYVQACLERQHNKIAAAQIAIDDFVKAIA